MKLNFKDLLDKYYVNKEIMRSISYFDLISIFPPISLHPGGINSTAKAIELAGLNVNDKVLEIGCGSGITTATLIKTGLKLTTIEKNFNLIESAKKNCRKHCNIVPNFIIGDVFDIDNFELNCNEFDAILFECVIGFVEKKITVIDKVKKYLKKNTGKIIVCDMHYKTEPNKEVLYKLSQSLGCNFEILYESDWLKLFKNYKKLYWEKFNLLSSKDITAEKVRQLLLAEYPEIDDIKLDICNEIKELLNNYSFIFNKNKEFCDAHIGIFSIN